MSARVTVHVKPGSKRCAVQWDGNCLRVWLTAPPVEGKANEQLLAVLKEYLGVPVRNLKIISGLASKHKLIEVAGLSQGELNEILGAKAVTIGDNGS